MLSYVQLTSVNGVRVMLTEDRSYRISVGGRVIIITDTLSAPCQRQEQLRLAGHRVDAIGRRLRRTVIRSQPPLNQLCVIGLSFNAFYVAYRQGQRRRCDGRCFFRANFGLLPCHRRGPRSRPPGSRARPGPPSSELATCQAGISPPSHSATH